MTIEGGTQEWRAQLPDQQVHIVLLPSGALRIATRRETQHTWGPPLYVQPGIPD